jgi:hypothetical protein
MHGGRRTASIRSFDCKKKPALSGAGFLLKIAEAPARGAYRYPFFLAVSMLS